tara:strand:+ start:801 stop:1550 length:750 start_codon:yes stop_codon:yes gene_type:complete
MRSHHLRAALAGSGSGSSVLINQTGLSVYYDFGNTSSWAGNSNSTAITDLSGNSNNATLQGTTYAKDTADGGSITFGGHSNTNTEGYGRFTLGSALTFTNTQDFTLFVGYKLPASYSGSWFMFAGNNDGDNFIGRYSASFFRIQDGSNNNIDISGSTGGGRGMQSHYSGIKVFYAVKDNQTGYFYEEGLLSNGGTTNTSFSDITLSSNQYDNSTFYPAYQMFFWGIYSRALSASEIASNYSVHEDRLGI